MLDKIKHSEGVYKLKRKQSTEKFMELKRHLVNQSAGFEGVEKEKRLKQENYQLL